MDLLPEIATSCSTALSASDDRPASASGSITSPTPSAEYSIETKTCSIFCPRFPRSNNTIRIVVPLIIKSRRSRGTIHFFPISLFCLFLFTFIALLPFKPSGGLSPVIILCRNIANRDEIGKYVKPKKEAVPCFFSVDVHLLYALTDIIPANLHFTLFLSKIPCFHIINRLGCLYTSHDTYQVFFCKKKYLLSEAALSFSNPNNIGLCSFISFTSLVNSEIFMIVSISPSLLRPHNLLLPSLLRLRLQEITERIKILLTIPCL